MKLVLDTSVYVAACLNPQSGSGELLRLWQQEALFDVVVSPELMAELLETLQKPKLQARFAVDEPQRTLNALLRQAEHWSDMPLKEPMSRDAQDDYLIALVMHSKADALVSLDEDLLVLRRIVIENNKAALFVRPGDVLAWLKPRQ